LKSICEMLGFLFSVFSAIYYFDGPLAITYTMSVWFIWFEGYIIKALFLASSGFEIAATFNCALSIENKMKWCQTKVSFWLWAFSILVLSFGLEMFPIFTLSINEHNYINKYNKSIHFFDVSSNRLSSKLRQFGLADSIIKEIVFLIILLSLNIYILFKIVQIRKRKKRLSTNISNIQNSNRAENRKITMIIVLFSTYFSGHLPNVIFFVFSDGYFYTEFWANFINYVTIFLYVSYSTSFFVYFSFNNIFRRLFLKMLPFVLFNSK
jgi:hypothetical protein